MPKKKKRALTAGKTYMEGEKWKDEIWDQDGRNN